MSAARAYGEAFRVSQSLRSKDFSVLQETWPTMSRKHLAQVENRARQLSINHVIIVGFPELSKKNEALVLSAQVGSRNGHRAVEFQDLSSVLGV